MLLVSVNVVCDFVGGFCISWSATKTSPLFHIQQSILLMENSSSPQNLPLPRKLALGTPLANLGNTCYINSVLQCLTHSQDLCRFIEISSHQSHCPIAISNRSIQTQTQAQGQAQQANFCVLCSLESQVRVSLTNWETHLVNLRTQKEKNRKLDSSAQPRSTSALPTSVISPTTIFENLPLLSSQLVRGRQEDSHEFLRLLIQRMQESVHNELPRERVREAKKEQDIDSNESFEGSEKKLREEQGEKEEEKEEEQQQQQQQHQQQQQQQNKAYPYSLFTGSSVSTITCPNCNFSSSKTDPIEDIGVTITEEDLTLVECLKKYTDVETGVDYTCTSCNSPVKASKCTKLKVSERAFWKTITHTS